MKLFTGWLTMPAVAVMAATGAQAQVPAPYEIDQRAVVVSDLTGPYAAVPGPVEDDGAQLLPVTEVFTVVREQRILAARSAAAARLRLHHRCCQPRWR